MKKLLERYIAKTFGEGVIQDLQLVLGSGFNVFHMLNPETIRHPDSEVNFRKKLLISKVKPVIKPNLLLTNDQLNYPQARVIFVNGIVTPYRLARHQADMLSRAIGQQVSLVHNETEGLIKDLLESNEGRYGIINSVAQKTIAAIEEKLSHPGELLVVAYSQGAIIASSALAILAARLPETELARIRYVTFGAGFKSSVLPDAIQCEHFANSDDPITLLGLQQPEYPYSGSLFIRQAKGHFFIADYLVPMLAGEQYGASYFESRLLQLNNV